MRQPGAHPARWTVKTTVLYSLLAVVAFTTSDTAGAHEGHAAAEGVDVMSVVAVQPDGPAARAGLLAGDRIVHWDGETLSTNDSLSAFLGARRPGDAVALDIQREGELHQLTLTLGDRGDGTPSLGLSLGVAAAEPPAFEGQETLTSDQCRDWLAGTYRVEQLAAELGLEVAEPLALNRSCVDRDLAVVPASIPRGWCDNVFKVHCSGLDLLAELGDALVGRCEQQLNETLGFDVGSQKAWATCGESAVFDAYSLEGRVLEGDECRSAYIDTCGGSTAAPAQR